MNVLYAYVNCKQAYGVLYVDIDAASDITMTKSVCQLLT